MTTLDARVAALEAEVSRLGAHNRIRHILSRYAIGVDEKRPDVLRAIFCPDARVSVPAWNVEVAGIEPILGFFENYWRSFDEPRRYYANEDITVDGERATAFMYWHVTQARGEESVLGWGTYDWGFRAEQGQWLIETEVVHIRAMTTLERGWAAHGEQLTL